MAERRNVVEEERGRFALSLLRAIELGERFGMVFGFLVRATEIEPRQPEIEDLLRLDESCHGVGRSPLLERDLSLDHLGVRSRLRFQLLYFSLSTLTGVSYGDITPLNAGARSLAALEGVMGQLFPVVLLARLVSMELRDRP